MEIQYKRRVDAHIPLEEQKAKSQEAQENKDEDRGSPINDKEEYL